MPLFADHTLAARLEALVAASLREFAETTAELYPESGAEWLGIGGGVAAFCSAGSPLNSVAGLGFEGEVSAGEIEVAERFFRDRGERPVANVCPLAHPSLLAGLSARGWTAEAFENVLVRELDPTEALPSPDEHVEIRVAETPEDQELWALMVANGFSAPEDPTPAEMRLGRTASKRARAVLLLALIDGQPAGTGEVELFDEVAWLSADTTLPHFRGRGVQRSLQRERLAIGRRAGCTIAVTESVPGSPSQRNMERLGFRVAYTRADVAGPRPPDSPPAAVE